jgi:Zn-dependent membrane protease YugP
VVQRAERGYEWLSGSHLAFELLVSDQMSHRALALRIVLFVAIVATSFVVATSFIAAWVLAPAGIIGAWPLLVLSAAATLLPLAVVLIYQLHERMIDRPELACLRDSTAVWLRDRLARLGLGATDVVTCPGLGTAFHPPSNTIILDEATYSEHTVRARATAAHELGHAALNHARPRLSRFLLGCRAWSDALFSLGVSVLVATVVIAVPGFRALGFALIAAAAILYVGVLVDEASASLRARWLLSIDPEIDGFAARAASTGMVLAFITYAIRLVVMVLPLIFCSELDGRLGGGLIELGPALAGWSSWLAGLGAVVAIAGGLGGVLSAIRGRRDGRFASLAVLATTLIGPAFTFAVAGQAEVLAHPWVIAVAAIPAWEYLVAPIVGALDVATRRAARGIDRIAPLSRYGLGPQLGRKRVIRPIELALHESPGLLDRIGHLRHTLLYLPIALAYLGVL